MRVRETYFKDYGLDRDKIKQIKKWCLDASPDEKQSIILDACKKSNPALMDALYFSITQNIGFDTLCRSKYVPLPKIDFYGYQRKAYMAIHDRLKADGKLP